MPAAEAAASPSPLFLQSGPITLFGSGWLDAEKERERELLLLLQNTHDDVNPPREGEREMEKCKLCRNEQDFSRQVDRREEKGEILISPFPSLPVLLYFRSLSLSPFVFSPGRVAFDSAKLHENVSPSISLKSHRSGLNSLLRLAVMQCVVE